MTTNRNNCYLGIGEMKKKIVSILPVRMKIVYYYLSVCFYYFVIILLLVLLVFEMHLYYWIYIRWFIDTILFYFLFSYLLIYIKRKKIKRFRSFGVDEDKDGATSAAANTIAHCVKQFVTNVRNKKQILDSWLLRYTR